MSFLKKLIAKVIPEKETPKTKKSRAKTKTAKEIATQKGEPYISVLKVEVDQTNPRYGSFELDWNAQFIENLKLHGYRGERDEDLVDQWFQDVCRHVVLESYEQEQANIARSDNIVRYINRKPSGDGKTEVS